MHFSTIILTTTLAATVLAAPKPQETIRGVHWRNDYKANQPQQADAQVAVANVNTTTAIRGIHWRTDYKGPHRRQAGAPANAHLTYQVSEYNTNSPAQAIGLGSFTGSYTESANLKTQLDDVNDIQPYLRNLVKSGTIKVNENSYLPIHFAPGISITQGGSGSCQTFCAYHGTVNVQDLGLGVKYLYYGVIPDQGGACAGGCGADPNPFNNLCSVASHELGEMITDPAVGVGRLAWYDNNNGEIGDICNANQGLIHGSDGTKYTVQAMWSNEKKACIITKPGVTATPAVPTSTSVVPPRSTSTTVVPSSSSTSVVPPRSTSTTVVPSSSSTSVVPPHTSSTTVVPRSTSTTSTVAPTPITSNTTVAPTPSPLPPTTPPTQPQMTFTVTVGPATSLVVETSSATGTSNHQRRGGIPTVIPTDFVPTPAPVPPASTQVPSGTATVTTFTVTVASFVSLVVETHA
ncbi:hypothetical protein HDU76_002672 [Blyttiomyces sp. JEL0837]|nr:hypothetical protein HDU76_002672 [Blyttiomyces sp. JEL0837]